MGGEDGSWDAGDGGRRGGVEAVGASSEDRGLRKRGGDRDRLARHSPGVGSGFSLPKA